MKRIILFQITFLISITFALAQQTAGVEGSVKNKAESMPGATVRVIGTHYGAATDENGNYFLSGIKPGKILLEFRSIGFVPLTREISLEANETRTVNVQLREDNLDLNEVVVSATRDRVARDKAPVVVNTISPKLFKAVNSISVAQSLNYSPGVRVETNCQNCNTTQVRLNGLEGRYSQILVDSRPVFSALNGVYGLEQIPSSILDRVEVIRSGGSALYGSNAIAGTINIITKEPVLNSWEVSTNLGYLDGKAPNRSINFNTSVVSDDLKSGITTFGLFRNRDSYDANGDGFSELTALENNTLGFNAFVKPGNNSKLRFNMTATHSFRRGGDRLDIPPQFADIAEQLDHNTVLGGLTFDSHSDDMKNKYSVYISAQHTTRKSYYGGLFGRRTRQDSINAGNAFGNTANLSIVSGGKYIHSFNDKNNITAGIEYKFDRVDDETPGYEKVNIQDLNSIGFYGQYSYRPFESFAALLGARLDHVKVDGLYTLGSDLRRNAQSDVTVLSPRITILYKIFETLKFRGGYARGFQAPQAYDENFEVSSAGGLQQFTILSDNMKTEFSNAYTASLNYTYFFKGIQTNFLVEGFYTELENQFSTVSTGTTLGDGFLLNEIQNGTGSYVTGVNFDLGISPSSRFTAKVGGTFQKAVYKEGQILYTADPESTTEKDVIIFDYTRTPDLYGYLSFNTEPIRKLNLDVTGTYTGSMLVPHVVSEKGYLDMVDTESFLDLNLKLSSHVEFTSNLHVTFSAGVQNVFNSYQSDFDKGPTRDADYVYGPLSPRTFFVGITMGNL